ncbi:MAG: glutamine synthetase [Ramlibacter sp.]|nr:glutamine synthetase [Ramlibacter sp.]
MISFAARCGIHDDKREARIAQLMRVIGESGVEQVRFVWCDLHGVTRGKTLMTDAAERAMREGVGMVSTLMLKDTSDRTAYKVFEPGGASGLAGFEFASNLMLLPDLSTFRQLPWVQGTGWLQCQPWFQDGTPVEYDTRRVLQAALRKLGESGLQMKCGLEVEFHIYKIVDTQAQLDPAQADWPGPPPNVAMIHPGYNLLTESWFDMAEAPMRIVRDTAQALGLPLISLEIELGPSQVEAVFEPTDALTAADNMVLFRNGVKQALLRAGYHATFMCRPPFPNIMSSGWHLHQSLVDGKTGANAFMRDLPATGTTRTDAGHSLSDIGEHYLAGLLEHARAAALFCTPTANGYGRYRPNTLAPQSVLWGRDNRGAMLRVIGECGDAATRMENRIGEPAANPYLYMASQIYSGLDGMARKLKAPPATQAPYAATNDKLPTSLSEALDALRGSAAMTNAFGERFIRYYTQIKQAELTRLEDAKDKDDFQRREYFGRF